jgi:carbon-monoxide dehydrogenase large subunit
VQDVELGARRDGTIVGLRATTTHDAGAYGGGFLPMVTMTMSSGVYRIPKIAFTAKAVVTNTTPTGAYRGAGRPEAAALVERSVDLLADELGIDPAEIRRRNFIPPDAFPYETPTGATYDSGEYERALDEALRLARYDELRKEQDERRRRGDTKLLGIGISSYVEISGRGSEFGSVTVNDDGSVTVLTGSAPHGQGHETAWAQIAASVLGVPFESITVLHSDTAVVPRGVGTFGSRSLQLAGSAVYRAGEAVLAKAKEVAAHLLEASVDDIVSFDDGRLGVAGTPVSALGWAELAQAARRPDRPEGIEPGLEATIDFEQNSGTFPFGSHVAVVEVDTETGRVELERMVAVDDCGTVLNPMLAEGQVHGGLAQGIAQALYEAVVYDRDGNPLTTTLADYAFPSAAELPMFETAHTETPSPHNPLGAKGIGESGTTGSTPAVWNAVIDAVSHLGIRELDMPLTPERVWRAIQSAKGATS